MYDLLNMLNKKIMIRLYCNFVGRGRHSRRERKRERWGWGRLAGWLADRQIDRQAGKET